MQTGLYEVPAAHGSYTPTPRVRAAALICYASVDLAAATQVERALEAAGLDVWLDQSEIQLGVLLTRELQDSITACRTLILLWSQTAAGSRWVNMEWIA